MDLNTIVQRTNDYIAGEQLTFPQLKIHLDSVIDDINSRLNANFPSFSEFNNTYPQYPNYNLFPDNYIRTVVTLGAAYKFYVTDEEGIETATKYAQDYMKNLFIMERDYIDKVPEAYQSDNTGAITETPTYGIATFYDDMF